MEFVIRKNATLPLLKMQVVKDGRGTYEDFMSFIETSTIYFSMQNIDNGGIKINTAFAGFVEKTFIEPNATPEYYLYYRFSKRDTNKVGRFEGQFLLKNANGTLVLPIREKLIINVKDSIFEDDLDYSECFVGKYECCIIGPPSYTTPTPTTTPTISVTPSITPTNTVTNSQTPIGTTTSTPTPTLTPTPTDTTISLLLEAIYEPGSVVANYILTASRNTSEDVTMSFTNVLGTLTGSQITIVTGVTITNGNISGSTIINLGDDYNNLDRSSIFSAITVSYTGGTFSYPYEDSSFFATATPTNTLTNSSTPTPTPTNTITNSQTPTPTNTISPTITPTETSTPQLQFQSIWNANSAVSLPYSPTGTYSGTIDWGDGTTSENTYSARTHNYASSGDYLITISGVIEGFNFGQYGSVYNSSIKEILSFGPLKVETDDFTQMFSGCTNLTLSAVTDTLDTSYGLYFDEMFVDCSSLSTVPNMGDWVMSAATSLNRMFVSCTLFNENINNWNVSNVSDITGMFLNSSSFNQPLSGWNTSSVGQMVGVFENAASFNQNIGMWNIGVVSDMTLMLDNTNIDVDNYSSILIGWANQIPSIQTGVTLGASNLIYSATTAQTSKNSLTGSPYNWIIIDSGGVGPLPSQTPTPTLTATPTITPSVTVTPNLSPDVTPTSTVTPSSTPSTNPFISIWSGSSVTLPYVTGGTYSGTIDWGDGFVSANTYSNRSHTYNTEGLYTITITGEITGFQFNIDENERLKIIEITSWGQLKGAEGSNASMFNFCSNLVLTGVTNIPNLSGITGLTGMFSSCVSITTINNLNSWDISGVNNIQSMFDSCILFNQDISGWDVSNIVIMNSVFSNCSSFNQNINGWITSGVTSMNATFNNSTSFNQPLSGWNISNVTNMSNMLQGTSLDVNNYSNILVSWANQAPLIQNNVVLNAPGRKYYAAIQSYRDTLTNPPYNWVITDSGQFDPTPTPTITNTPTRTPTRTPTLTPSITRTNTLTPSITPSNTATSNTPTVTPTNSITPSITKSPTPSLTPTQTLLDYSGDSIYNALSSSGKTSYLNSVVGNFFSVSESDYLNVVSLVSGASHYGGITFDQFTGATSSEFGSPFMNIDSTQPGLSADTYVLGFGFRGSRVGVQGSYNLILRQTTGSLSGGTYTAITNTASYQNNVAGSKVYFLRKSPQTAMPSTSYLGFYHSSNATTLNVSTRLQYYSSSGTPPYSTITTTPIAFIALIATSKTW